VATKTTGLKGNVRVIHWRAAEAGALLEECRKAGFEVDYVEGDGAAITRAIRARVPDGLVIDLSRKPSHGREVGIWLRRAKATRGVPIVFVGGEPEKVESVQALLPDAAYCEVGAVGAALRRVVQGGAGRRDFVTPPGIMERGLAKTAAQKLGIATGAAVRVVEAPRDFPELLGAVPEGVTFQEDAAPLTLWFVEGRAALLGSLREMRLAAASTKLWLVWRKGNGREVTQNVLRETAREVGLVDYKICSVDARWSGMLFARKRA
jgi:CheY-like chemotaxis protein